MTRLLVVKTSSMGDVVHGLVALAEARQHRPDLQVDWVVEEAFADLVRSSPLVDRVIPVAMRRWRKALFRRASWRELKQAGQAMRAQPHELLIDAQGLIKSAALVLLSGQPRSGRWGFDRASAREPLASCVLGHGLRSAPSDHAVWRLRSLFGAALGYRPDALRSPLAQGPLLLKPQPYPERLSAVLPAGLQAQAVILGHGSSRPEKQLATRFWASLARGLVAEGLQPVMVWGSPAEHQQALAVAQAAPGLMVLPRLSLGELGPVLSGAAGLIGLDSGLSHWSAALGRPSLALFPATPASRFGLHWAALGDNLESAQPDPALVLARWQALRHRGHGSGHGSGS